MQYDTAVQRGKAPEKYRKAPFTVRLVRFLKYIPVFLLLFGFAFLLLAPLLWMCLGAFKSDPEVLSYPPKYFPVMNHFPENWANVLKQIDFMGMTVNTAIYAIGTTIPAMFVNALAGYAFARFRFRGKNVLFLLFLATMMIPFQVVMVPLYLEVYYMGWLNNFWGLIVPKIASAYWVFLCRSAFEGLPKDLEDAARIDGMNEFGIFAKIMLPQSRLLPHKYRSKRLFSVCGSQEARKVPAPDSAHFGLNTGFNKLFSPCRKQSCTGKAQSEPGCQ